MNASVKPVCVEVPAETMRAARQHDVGGKLHIDQVPVPTPRPDEVLIKVEACGVVPNLINVLEHGTTRHKLVLPTLPGIYGLDPAGVVVAKGTLVHDVEIGQRVYVNPLRYCGSCRTCRMGNVEVCPYGTLNGYFGLGEKSRAMFDNYPYGGYAEYMTAPHSSLVLLPDNLSFETAARWGYLGTAYKALRRAKVNMSTTLLINGVSGTLGLGLVAFALALGVPKIMGVGRNAMLLERVRSLAPDRISVHSTYSDTSISDWVASLTDGIGADVVIDALPTNSTPESFLNAFEALSRGGTHVNVGGVIGGVPIDFMRVCGSNQSLLGSMWFTAKDGQEMADLVGSGTANLDMFEHNIFALDEVNHALETIDCRSGGFSNYVISPSLVC